MLCKKCKTSLSYKQSVCGYCGSKQINTQIIAVIFVVLLIAAALFYLLFLRGYLEGEIVAPTDNEQQGVPAATATPIPADVPTEKPGTQGVDKKTEDEIWDTLNKILNSAIIYYNKYSAYRPFVTKYGYLYDLTVKSYITPEDLYYTGLLKQNYVNEPIYILYVYPKDMPSRLEEEGLKLYVVYETDDKFAILGQGETGYMVTREDYQILIEGYNFVHGEIKRHDDTDEDYTKIVDAIMSYMFTSEAVDVRYIAADEKFAAAAVSYSSDSGIIFEYALEKTNNEWSVVIPNFETFADFRIRINEILVNFNLDLLPEFDLLNFAGQHRQDFTQINEMITATKYLSENERVIFEAGTTDIIYQEYSTGRRLIFGLTEDKIGWRVLEASNWQEAEAVIKDLSKRPPTFLIRQTSRRYGG